MTATAPTATRRVDDLVLEIEGTPAAEILLDIPCSRFCSGSDTLERLGLWDCDGGLTDLGRDVRDYLRQDRARHDAPGSI